MDNGSSGIYALEFSKLETVNVTDVMWISPAFHYSLQSCAHRYTKTRCSRTLISLEKVSRARPLQDTRHPRRPLRFGDWCLLVRKDSPNTIEYCSYSSLQIPQIIHRLSVSFFKPQEWAAVNTKKKEKKRSPHQQWSMPAAKDDDY